MKALSPEGGHVTQNDAILEWLEKGYTLTGLQALRLFNCFRLGARVFELKAQGHDIRSEMVRGENGKHYKQYWLARQFELFPKEPIPASEYHNYPNGGGA